MCEPMTSHLYRLNDGPVVYDSRSHSSTRRRCGLSDIDASVAEVEWKAGADAPEIRFPDSWGENEREQCRAFYRRNMPTRLDMMRWCVTHAADVKIMPGEEHVLDGVKSLPQVTTLDCSDCTGLKALPALPQATRLNGCRCTGLTALPALPRATWLDCSRCTGLTSLPGTGEPQTAAL